MTDDNVIPVVVDDNGVPVIDMKDLNQGNLVENISNAYLAMKPQN